MAFRVARGPGTASWRYLRLAHVDAGVGRPTGVRTAIATGATVSANARNDVLNRCRGISGRRYGFRGICSGERTDSPDRSGHHSDASAAEWDAHEYADAARKTLDAVYEGALAAAEDGALGADFDAEFDGNVVRLLLGDGRGTYVANTQTPNRQIWLSSPVSGPWRYGWSAEQGQWVSTRDGHAMLDLLERELSDVAGRDVSIPDASQMR
jgi:frataxin